MRRLIWALVAANHLACPGSGDPDLDAGPGDGGTVDPCGAVDASLGVCDPVIGGGCSVGEACGWSVDPDQGQCRCSSGTAALGASCTYRQVSCAAGLACLPLRPGEGAECWQVCDQRASVPCARLNEADPGTAYECFPVGLESDGPVSQRYGVCFALGTRCDPLDDRCPAAEVCTLYGTVPACGPRGTRGIGEGCEDEGCARGGLCVTLQDQNGMPYPRQCYQTCELARPNCTLGTCADVGLAFGLCL
ncbi:MAG: hypothetical protein IPG45_34945 [Deltaproteobacteria bacterium]|nr:hypothetical protein [Deltaproteobacteria bacterium]